MYFITIWDNFTSVWVCTALDHCTSYARVEMVLSEAINDFWVVAGMMAFMWGISDFCSIWKSTLMIEYMCMRPSHRPLQIPSFCTDFDSGANLYHFTFCLRTYLSSPTLGLLIDPTKRPNLGFIHTQGQPRGRGVLLPQVVNFGAIQGRSQWTRSPLFLPTYEMLLRWLPRGQVFQAEQSSAISYGQLWNAAFF